MQVLFYTLTLTCTSLDQGFLCTETRQGPPPQLDQALPCTHASLPSPDLAISLVPIQEPLGHQARSCERDCNEKINAQ